MDYLTWNQAIANHFFRPELAGKPVVLCVTRETLGAIAGLFPDAAVADFVAACKDGPEWTQFPGCGNVLTKALNCLYLPGQEMRRLFDGTGDILRLSSQHWSIRQRFKVPPYLGYLALFVLAAEDPHRRMSEYRYGQAL